MLDLRSFKNLAGLNCALRVTPDQSHEYEGGQVNYARRDYNKFNFIE
jgi:hypothetical protein